MKKNVFKCDICCIRFAQEFDLKSHMMKTHEIDYEQKHTALGERRHKCSLCPKSFVSPRDFKDHMNTHTGEKPYVCTFCGKRSASFGTHRGHERSHTGHRRTK